MIRQILSTEDGYPALIARMVAGIPLVGVGIQHLTGAAPLLPIIQGTALPLPELNAMMGPVIQVIGGSMLLLGGFARLGALMGAGAMAVALFTHLTFEPYTPVGASAPFVWADEPPLFLPIAVLLACLYVALRGAGTWSVDRRLVKRGPFAAAGAALVFLLAAPSAIGEAPEPASGRVHYELDGKLALQGYDAVAYFKEGKAVKGEASIQAEHHGVTYYFSKTSHREAFQKEPDRYRPAYGGWCAWAMVDGDKTRPDPTNFILNDGRLFLFFKNFFVDTKAKWQRGDPPALEVDADRQWATLLGMQ